MSENPTEPQPVDPTPAPQPTPPAQPDPRPAEPAAQEWDGKVESLPPAAQKLIRDLRKDDGDERVAKKTLDAIQKALNPDAKPEEKADPAQLTKLLSERDAETKQLKAELAVYRSAGKHGADPDALLDSRGFLAKIADLDPTDSKAITKAITEAVNENPKLKAVQVAGSSGADFNGGSGEGAVTQAKFDAMSNAEKNALYKSDPNLFRRLAG
ncbi:hypothetical protein NNX28_16975 [Arthrobacter sp. zg-Y859]|uniref:Scaffolding protein n=1 Tax=Arthrobacter jinronghuae TaxID=2964609 RepID=A0ABT1NVB7_9MICC|nr:hypothetical protein [Arthrobacter jinronghuae]MCQ1951613.1 hypothetical protein [Arthrobacter jinronghuae]UWX79673.1 hypothetical protein N2K98_05605 [Arthrobacter jinronghuae]